ncbi:hypothetical protein J7F03_20540 [Streptomyces sp. ISL-43]|uniref:hypothetical protein n=1 Tax=Streptomyces sp. ISL-43 TaxID=2819183 RepID=UPI001BE8CE49|nr:hypothetical protein [Streptomyces sp. ISL-43]MBT2449432.1 hypothetical protein [Streptomyces sp. ISL-43]
MADSDKARERPRAQQVQVVISPLVPDGRAMIPIQMADHTVLAVHPDHVSKQFADELQHHFAHAEQVGLLTSQHLPRPDARPHPCG